ncbi:MAG: hypothetical protein U0452_11985 [Anaerolineae bacterium]
MATIATPVSPKTICAVRPLVRPGGLIAFHDIRPNRFDSSIEVWRLWDEIKAGGALTQFVREPYPGRYGIGVVERQE